MHVPLHWIALKLDTENHQIFLCDSLPGVADSGTIIGQMQDLSQQVSGTSCQEIMINVPHQRNIVDCGVTTCLFMLCLAEGIDPNDLQYESEAFMRHFRLRILADIVNNKVTRPRKKA
jgi:Ulp1 family protease